MKNVFEHIEKIKGKPHHIRKQVAFSAAVVGATAVALVWFIGGVSTDAFAIRESSFADIAGQKPAVAETGNTSQNIAGAAAAVQNENKPAHIEIIDISSSTSSEKHAEQTIIPF